MLFSTPKGLTYVTRPAINSPDFTETNFVLNSAWHTLSLSSIIPTGCKLVHINVLIKNTVINKSFCVRSPLAQGAYNEQDCFTPVINVYFVLLASLEPNSAGEIQYYGSSGSGTWTILFSVIGWWI